MLEIGSVIDGKYKVLNKIGQGGMSVVYLAMNEKANKQWAIKEVRKDGVKDYEVVKQGLIVETDLLKKLNHPNLPSIIDVIDSDDTFLIVMDYIEGKPLLDYVENNGPQRQEDVIEWSKQLCDVMGYLHSREPAIIYRDLKPGNIMLRPDGRIMLIDFGTAREFKERNIADTVCLGTIGYAAPEQFGGHGQTDARTDIYGLGATMYHLITGTSPCDPPYKILPIRDIDPRLSSGLEKIILKCTQQDPNDRYQSCEELMYDLNNYDKIDDMYRKSLKKKLAVFCCAASASVLFLTSGIVLGKASSAKINDNYSALLETAEKTNETALRNDCYIKAVSLRPDKADAYIGLINSMKSDSVFSLEEETVLQEAIVKNEDGLKENNKSYADVCFEIGKLYWYYYEYGSDPSKDSLSDNKAIRMKSAIKWFDLALSSADDSFAHSSMAVIYRDIGLFYRDIVMNTAEASDSGIYRELFDNYSVLVDMVSQKNEGEIVELELYELIQSSIEQYAVKFKSDGVTYKEIAEMLDYIKSRLNEISVTTDITKDIKESVTDRIDGTVRYAEAVYGGAGS